MVRLTVVLLAMVASLATPALAVAVKLTAAEIKATFATGMPFMASSTSGETFTFVFKADGTATQMAPGSTKAVSGTWHTSQKGYCTKWAQNAEHCYTVEKNGAVYDVRDAAGKVISHWSL